MYYTPIEVARCQVRLAADLLERRLGYPEAFGDPSVLVVDPATGSGVYPLAVAADVEQRGGRVWPELARRLWLWEPLGGAASIARTQLAAALGTAEEEIHVEEADALSCAPALEAPVVVCLGNPPYNRGRAARRPHSRAILSDFQTPEGRVHAKNLYNDYVYFWRWALRAVFERRRGPGVVTFVTASSYLRGPAFAGLRSHLRRLLDELWILDLEGDHLAARRTHNVFKIRTPVAIAVGVRYRASALDVPAAVHYARLEGNRSEKLSALDGIHRLEQVAWRPVAAGWGTPLLARVNSAYATWPQLVEIFPWQLSGAQLKRTWPIAPTSAVLEERWQRLLDLPPGAPRARAFRETRDRDLDSTPMDLIEPGRRLQALQALEAGTACLAPVRYAYRSFDRQWVLPDARLGDFMRPALWRIAGARQIYLTTLLTNVLGPGPAAVATALVPDLDCFRGSFGARAVIPLWRDLRAACPNLAENLLDRLTERYGFEVIAEDVLAYCYGLLATGGFQARFEEELRTPGPRVPLTGDPDLFRHAAALGACLLALHTFGQRYVPAGQPQGCVAAGQARWLGPARDGYPGQFGYDARQQTLRVGEGLVAPVTEAAWTFGVSGLRVLPGWLGRRVASPEHRRQSSPLDAIKPRAWSAGLAQELLELLWVLEATLAMAPAQDALLDEIVRTAPAFELRN